jgi:GT2 family glycosyltransferase
VRTEVLIPTWNRAADLRRALLALAAQTVEHGVCVVDNASTDDTAGMVAEQFPEARYVRLESNEGFGRALNRGVEESEADLLVFVNNDTVPDRRFVEAVSQARERSGAEMVAACLRTPGGTVDSMGVQVDRALNAYDVGLGERYGDPRHHDVEPLGPTGGAAAYAHEAFATVGGFDEAIFAYLEDVDLALQMRMRGMRCALAYDAFAWHHHSSTLGSGSSTKNRLLSQSRGHLLWKYGANLSRVDRAAGLLTDAIVYSGKLVLDRNAAAFRGRLDSRRDRREPRPGRDPRFASVPRVPLGLAEGLRRRLGRRR